MRVTEFTKSCETPENRKTHPSERIVAATVVVYALGGRAVVRHEDDDAVLQHRITSEGGDHLAHAFVQLGHHGRVDAPLGVAYVGELGDLVVGRLQGLVVVAAVRRQMGEVEEHGACLRPVLADQPHGLGGEEVRRVLADGVARDAHVAPHVEAQEALAGVRGAHLVRVVVLQAVLVAEVRVKAPIGGSVLATVKALVPFTQGVRYVARVLQVLKTARSWIFSYDGGSPCVFSHDFN